MMARSTDLYPVEKVELRWPSVRRVGCGLVNPHATCFMNASFQALFHLPPVVAWLEGGHGAGGEPGPFTGKLLRLYAKMQASPGPVHAKEFCEPGVIGQICAGHHTAKMEYAEEWLMGLLGRLHEEAVADAVRGGSAAPEMEYTSFLYRIFGGKLRNQICCLAEDFTRNVEERFASLEVELGEAKTIEEALASYTRGERLDGDNKYRLEHGPGKHDFRMVDATKRITISQAPNALMVVLKRFPLPDMKDSRKIKFSATLDVQPYMSEDAEESGPMRYDLNAVIVHAGETTQSGHYFTYAKAANGMWHLFNDESVQSVRHHSSLHFFFL
ncbi:hypothetical protein BSKO_00065 [Bryopsis sp. KO-2023]|nr:hypothetical protein BSKO_00065 [Bryopsis sp. KO-2023]